MHFAHLNMVIWSWIVIGLVLFLLWTKQHRAKMLRNFTQEHLLKDIAFHFDPKKAKYKNILLVAVAVFTILALMRPQWGFHPRANGFD